MSINWFGRDPAAVVGAVVAGLIAVIYLLPLYQTVTAALAAVVIAAGGALVALTAHADGQLAAVLGLVRAGLALGIVLGWHITDTQQALVLAAMEALAALLLRTQISAPQAADGTWRNKVTV